MNDIDKQLFRRLYIKYITQDKQGIKSNKQQIIKDYFQITGGVKITDHIYKELVLSMDKEQCYRESRGDLPTRKVEDYGVQEKEGLYYSDKYIEIDVHSKLSPEDVLKAHGFDPDKWEIVNAGSTGSRIGTAKNDEQYFINTYRKVSARPKKPEEFKATHENLVKMWKEVDLKPIEIIRDRIEGTRLLKISLNDVHIWNNCYEDYKYHIAEIVALIESRQWDSILIKQGGDWFHANNAEGLTVGGTKVAHDINKNKMYKWGMEVIQPIIESSIKQSNETHYVYIEGNHDKDLGWSFAWGLKQIYPQIKFDIEEEVYKKFVYKDVLLFMLHGDKPRTADKNKDSLFVMLFGLFKKEMAYANTIEVHSEHIHHEKVVDNKGIVFRTNPTANNTDKYHHENGFLGARKIFQCFEYTSNAIKTIHNIDGIEYYLKENKNET